MAAGGSVWALDFDGVVCDSVGESSLSAWQASAELWPDLFAQPAVQVRRTEILDKMRTVRPVVETGYENLVQVRCLLEGVEPQDILTNWHALLPEYMQKWDLQRSELVERFGVTRDDWIARDLPDWLAANGIYAGLPELLQSLNTAHELYIVTTKQARFTEALLHNAAHLPLPAERIFSTAETGQPKSKVLAQLQAKHPGTEYHFVEDKLSTLEKVAKVPELDAWKLYLVDWGYNTVMERARAAADPRVEVVDLAALTAAAR
ncbi:hypothetical protein WJX81_001239 [Elliptochloris bilobata]|uniref:Uncharacterized protein n=1 Tax=Elliptochloris bilobata TaxID=381761 RepID=A0AAW1S0S7_9CHLO